MKKSFPSSFLAMNELPTLSCLLDHMNSAADFNWGLMSFAICFFLLGTFNGDTPPRIVFFVFFSQLFVFYFSMVSLVFKGLPANMLYSWVTATNKCKKNQTFWWAAVILKKVREKNILLKKHTHTHQHIKHTFPQDIV